MLEINTAIKSLEDEIIEIENETRGRESEFVQVLAYKERLKNYKEILDSALDLLKNPQWYNGIELDNKRLKNNSLIG